MLKLATKFNPMPAAFETAKNAGFRNAEFWTSASLLTNWRDVAAAAQGHDMGFALHFPNHGDFEDSVLQHAVDLYNALDCSAMVIHQPMYHRHGKRLFELQSQLRLGIENHFLNKAEIESWATESRYLTLDVEHYWKFTMQDSPLDELVVSVRDFLHRFGHKLVHVHLPGYVPGFKEHRPQYCSREMVTAMFDLFDEYGYEGFIVSETDAAFQNPEELRMDMLLFEHWRKGRVDRSAQSITIAAR